MQNFMHFHVFYEIYIFYNIYIYIICSITLYCCELRIAGAEFLLISSERIRSLKEIQMKTPRLKGVFFETSSFFFLHFWDMTRLPLRNYIWLRLFPAGQSHIRKRQLSWIRTFKLLRIVQQCSCTRKSWFCPQMFVSKRDRNRHFWMQ